ncbi:MAG: glycosyltransferase family 4 protein [Chthoniobacterales bacterium]
MRICLYTESPDLGPGGSEQFLAIIAEALSETHDVIIAHHKPEAAEKMWAEYTGCDLSRVQFRGVALAADESARARTPWTRFRLARAWRRELSEGCDCFVAFLHNKPPFCYAAKGAMVILFPTYEPRKHFDDGRNFPANKPKKKKKERRRKEGIDLFASALIHRWYGEWEWRRRLASYDVKFAISSFSRDWTRTRWGIETGLLYPPVMRPANSTTAKENRILSVGRFATSGHTKKQMEMLQAFAELRVELPGWRYSSLGGLAEFPADRAYFEETRARADGEAIEVSANVEHACLRQYFARAKIFWHAAGFGDDLGARPEMAEHFGLSTVEAMAHGCVPVVVRLGGQREIVEHGVSGFLWDSFAEMKNYTRQLAGDPVLLERMAAAARARAQFFSREVCVHNLLQALDLR